MIHTTDRHTERLNESMNGSSLVEYVGYEEKQTEAYIARKGKQRAADVPEVDNRESHECE